MKSHLRSLRGIFGSSSKVKNQDEPTQQHSQPQIHDLRFAERPGLCKVCRGITLKGLKTGVGYKHRLVKSLHDEFYEEGHDSVQEWDEDVLEEPAGYKRNNLECPLCVMIWQNISKELHWVSKSFYWATFSEGPVPESENRFLEKHVLLSFHSPEPTLGCATIELNLENKKTVSLGRLSLLLVKGLGASAVPKTPEWMIELDPSADSVTKWMKACVRECRYRSDHAHCSPSVSMELPTRLIDVGTANTPELRLGESKNLPRGSAISKEYVALSYCWGKEPLFRTTSANVEEMKIGIPEQQLPKTVRDAIQITRTLGFRYLWVDALCILQGNDEAAKSDWKRESVRMADVYTGSFLTICAAAATSAVQGFLFPRPTLEHTDTVKLPLIRDYLVSFHRLDEIVQEEALAPIHKRGWTLQEYLLSSRLLIYGRNEITWKCKGMNRRECGLEESARTMLSDWKSVVNDYSSRELTHYSDRLIAITALALARHKDLGLFLSGAWSSTILQDLVWLESDYLGKVEKIAEKLPNTESGAPSWSWASHIAQVSIISQPQRCDHYQVSVKTHLELSQESRNRGIQSPYSVLEIIARLGRTSIATIVSHPAHRHAELNPRYLSIRLDRPLEPSEDSSEEERDRHMNTSVWFFPIHQDSGVLLVEDSQCPISSSHKFKGVDLSTQHQMVVEGQSILDLPRYRRVGSYCVKYTPHEVDWEFLNVELGFSSRFLLV